MEKQKFEQKNLVEATEADFLYRHFYYFARNPGYSWRSSNENGRAEFSFDKPRSSTRNQRLFYVIFGYHSWCVFKLSWGCIIWKFLQNFENFYYSIKSKELVLESSNNIISIESFLNYLLQRVKNLWFLVTNVFHNHLPLVQNSTHPSRPIKFFIFQGLTKLNSALQSDILTLVQIWLNTLTEKSITRKWNAFAEHNETHGWNLRRIKLRYSSNA